MIAIPAARLLALRLGFPVAQQLLRGLSQVLEQTTVVAGLTTAACSSLRVWARRSSRCWSVRFWLTVFFRSSGLGVPRRALRNW